MKIRSIFLILAVFASTLLLMRFVLWPARRGSESTIATKPTASQTVLPASVPAHYDSAPSLGSLGPVMPPEQLTGKTRDAYRVVREIPQTIAQMPCYCHCDRGFGHKSLHSCFEDDHAAHCAVCVDEALLAYRLQKQGLSAPQIREQIIAQFGD